MKPGFLRAAAWTGRALSWAAVSVGASWAAAALWIDGPASRLLAGALAGGFLLGAAALAALAKPRWRALVPVALATAVVAGWWLSIPARNDRDWQRDVARLARPKRDGSRVTIENVRNFDWRTETDVTERWETRTFDLDRLRGVDLFLSYWGPTLIAHTIASFEFEDGVPLAISIETRKEKGEEYSALLGFFRRYELCYVVADERDLIGIRAGPRGERVFLYRTTGGPEAARAVLEEYLKSIARIADEPAWYNALTQNCTTSIRTNAVRAVGAGPFDWRILANGRLDQLGYERGRIDTSLPFEEMRKRSDVTERAKAAAGAADFSARIREGLPGARK